MPKLNLNLFLDDDFETYGDRREHRLVGHKPGYQPKRSTDEVLEDISGEEGRDNFKFSYHASRHESEWLIDSLGHLYEEQWLDDVLRLLQGAKMLRFTCASAIQLFWLPIWLPRFTVRADSAA